MTNLKKLKIYEATGFINPARVRRERAIAGMHYFNQVLGEHEFIAGNDFSVADITVFAGLSFADFAKIEIPGECQNLITWRAKIAQRPSIEA